jgi:hypothetical protein
MRPPASDHPAGTTLCSATARRKASENRAGGRLSPVDRDQVRDLLITDQLQPVAAVGAIKVLDGDAVLASLDFENLMRVRPC